MEIQSPPPSLRLPADCSIGGIRAIYDRIRSLLTQQRDLQIDCSAVDKADVTSVQLLLSATRTADEQGGRLDLTEVSQSLKCTFQRAGIPSSAFSERSDAQHSETK
ncbi:ABC-type transporter Mla MlaB component [Rhodopseudomonas rhenobacensis]|uniref:ABC-type transporter Mla MlaB component n=1 Tax=Rhodopseudomonas rhenobacensis TaxID=87461 RepID=A0A7W7Z165_9BRAD|nr:STAS domain-containing protein [Rhodopseudomonas rhenobacensis]MBB5046033.1 ABC-type transporter Mla MlaB component [Rhodopseudomonas rhenobacensis]